MLLAALVYLNALHNPFVYDDYRTIVANRSIAPPIDVRRVLLHDATRPFVNASYAVDRALWGARPFGFHLTNACLHVLNVALLFALAWKVSDTRQASAAFASASLFAVHPMMTEAVGYGSGRAEVLSATFFLAALLAGRRWLAGGGVRWGTATIALWVVAIGSKETAAAFPFVLLLLDWLTIAGSARARKRRAVRIHLPLIAAAIAIAVVRISVLRSEYPRQVAPHFSYALLALDVVRRYLALLVNPARQTIFHAIEPVNGIADARVLLALAVIAGMVIVAWLVRRTCPAAALGLLWFVLVLGPSTTLIVLDQGEPMAEHRVYLASCGLFLAAGGGIAIIASRIEGRGPLTAAAAVAFALVLGAFAAETVLRNVIWRDPVTLWRESADLAPNHYWPRLALGEALLDSGRRDEAVEQFTTAIRLRPTEPRGYVKLGESLAEAGRFDEARRLLKRALELDPANESARRSLTTLDGMTRGK